MTIEEKGENSVSVNRIEGTKIGHGKRNQSEVPKPAVRKLVIDVVELSISVEIPTVQQEVNPVIDMGWKEIFKSIEDKAER